MYLGFQKEMTKLPRTGDFFANAQICNHNHMRRACRQSSPSGHRHKKQHSTEKVHLGSRNNFSCSSARGQEQRD